MLLLKNIRLVDEFGERGLCDVLVAGGKIADIGQSLNRTDAQIIDGGGAILLPSFVDLHAHFRDPGLTHKEDIHTGCRAAAHGGYTTVNLMANTKPVCSDMETVRYAKAKAQECGLCDVYQCVSITKDFDGETIDHIDNLEDIKWLSDDGFGIQRSDIMLKAMVKAKECGIGLMLHEEDAAIFALDSYFGEDIHTLRDVRLAEITGCKVHFCHVSTADSMRYIIEGKRRMAQHHGVTSITCEVSPHHLFLCDENTGRVNPPLRSREHRQALIEAVKAGYVDAIATDHAPHTPEDKLAGAPGFTGLDLAFATCYTALVKPGHIDLSALSKLLSANPARLMGIAGGRIAVGELANLTLVDVDNPFIADESCIHSKSKNSPVLGMQLYGRILKTIKEGRITYETC